MRQPERREATMHQKEPASIGTPIFSGFFVYIHITNIMYLSGSFYTYEERLHQLAETSGEVQQFMDARLTYTGAGITTGMLLDWRREELKKQIILKWPSRLVY